MCASALSPRLLPLQSPLPLPTATSQRAMMRLYDQPDSALLAKLADTACTFPLADLPYDLLEEVATYFFRPEAAEVLTVSKSFHSAFSRAVWKYLDVSGPYPCLPTLESAWLRYRHLVRSIRSTSTEFNEFPPFPPPNIQRLTVELTDKSVERFFKQELPSLRYLGLVLFFRFSCRASDVMNVVEWINTAHRNGQKLTVRWSMPVDGNEHIRTLNSMLEKIVALESHVFYANSMQNTNERLVELPKLVSASRHLAVIDPYTSVGFSEHGRVYFGNGEDQFSFSRLDSLGLDFADFHRGNHDLPFKIIPQRFPVIKKLELDIRYRSRCRDIEHAFSQHWPTVSHLKFTNLKRGEAKDYTVWKTVVRALPNLERLAFDSCEIPFDYIELALMVPRLRQFSSARTHRLYVTKKPNRRQRQLQASLSEQSQQQPQPQLQPQLQPHLHQQHLFSHLTRIELNSGIPLKHAHMYFLLCLAPSLHYIALNYGGFKLHKDALKHANGCTSLSVRTIYANCHSPYYFNEADFATFVGLFPNVATLLVSRGCLDKVRGLKEQRPGLVIQDDSKLNSDSSLYRWFYES
ncbi:hypothetical protein GQ42DRAFT_2667 [Ramicandelaber brevisporus]|nr:hypothetical protein GQ42DRAFT_2667 [Ramicandelaber brevisporus]